MKNCINCSIEFTPLYGTKYCSIKCKLSHNIDRVNDCWIWKGSRAGNRYGKFRAYGATQLAHRMSYLEFKGVIPQGLNVCHSCDVMACINPEHLFLATQKDNVRDAYVKNRFKQAMRKDNHFSKLNDYQIEELRLLRSEGFTYERLSRIFDLSVTQLYRIIKK